MKRTKDAHRTPRGKRASGAEINHFHKTTKYTKTAFDFNEHEKAGG
ncbi:hypothetical protein QUF49_07055 [Fictibacillus sp. b24]|nr:hypothetical protein [Fictibacillus sp. b24]MDM5315750.1 hypothetical protein [Fictibacillus sp. b24]